MFNFFYLAYASVGLLSLCHASLDAVVEDTSKGITYKGISQDGIESFRGIPYGDDVDGNRRFTRPVAKQIARGSTVDASKPGSACPQQEVPIPDFPFFSNVTDVSENCLNLRVDRVAGSSAKGLLPVMVWFYGGGLSIGQADDQVYLPQGLLQSAAAKSAPIIYVAMNYRLNIFGFANSEALHDESNTNVGLLDQRLALQWVKDNINAFGGDPENVTLFGESAGGMSVGLQIAAYGGKVEESLFKRAIMASGSPAAAGGLVSNTSSVATSAVAKALKCPLSPSRATLRCLRSVPLADLLNATVTHEVMQRPPYGFSVFLPYIDNSFLPDAPSELIRLGKFAKDIPINIGWNLDDASLFTSPTIEDEPGIAEYLESQGLSKTNAARALELYPATEFEAGQNASASYFRASRILRDFQMTCPAVAFAQAIAKYSPQSAQDTFMFQLDQSPLATFYEKGGIPYYGVSHFSDIFYVFNEIADLKNKFGATDSDLDLGNRMSASWASYATNGIPGSVKGRAANATLSKWESAFECEGGVNVFAIGGEQEGNVPIDGRTKHTGLNDLLQRCRFFSTKSVYEPTVAGVCNNRDHL